MNRIAWLGMALTLIVAGSIVLLFLVRKHAREADVIGRWSWGQRTVTFNENGDFIAVLPGSDPRLNFDGFWECQGKKVHFWTIVVDGPNPGWVYELSPDGKTMNHLSGNDQDDAEVMTKDQVGH